MKILILKPSSLGDVIQALPVLRLIKRHDPSSKVYWWIDSSLQSLLVDDPDLAGSIAFERRQWRSPLHWGGMLKSIREMRGHRFDLVIDLQALARSGVFAWLANGAVTIGLDDSRELAPGFYDISVPRPRARPHAVDWYLEVLRGLRIPTEAPFVWLPPHPGARRALEDRWNPVGRRWVVLVPGARWENKRWPAEYFARLGADLMRTFSDTSIVVLGGKEDLAAGCEIARVVGEKCLNLAGKTSLPELIEWIRLSFLVVSNDTGPMHVAAALGKPVWSLFGPTDKRRTGPFGQLDKVMSVELPCRPCLKARCHYEKPMECLRALLPSEVSKRIIENAIASERLRTA